MQVKCDCKDWAENIKQLTDMQIFCANHAGAPKWKGKIFVYCPWCGQKLTTNVPIHVCHPAADLGDR